MLTDQARTMLVREAERLEQEVANLRAKVAHMEEGIARAAAHATDLTADNARMRAALRMVMARARPIPEADVDGHDVGVSCYLSRNEWAWLTAAAGGYPPEVPGGESR